MNRNYRILIAGGDMRQVYCAQRLAETFDISVIGFDEKYLPEELRPFRTAAPKKGSFDCVLLPVPPIDEKGNITAPCFSGTVSPALVKAALRPEGIVLAGHTVGTLRESFGGYEVVDYLEREELSLKNAVPTAEGAVRIALDELPVTLNGLRVLVVGMGRIGTALCSILKGFGSDVTAAVHNEKGAAKARIAGVRSVPTEKISADYDLVFNTVPALIFDRDKLLRFSGSTLFIDLASKPGGIDFDSAALLGIKVIWALGIPGKSAPVTSGEIIAETAAEIIGERGILND